MQAAARAPRLNRGRPKAGRAADAARRNQGPRPTVRRGSTRIAAHRLVATLVILAAACVPGAAGAASVYRLGPARGGRPERLVPNANATTGNCGVERWSVKTGTDADAGKVDTSRSTAGTIRQLDSIKPPASLPANGRISPTETTVFTLDATLVEYRLEVDSDYHLVLTDGSGHTMITEIPDPACVDGSSPFLGDIQVARQVFDNHFSATDYFQNADVPVCLTGVGFFDFMHGQTGIAPNGIEIHPVLGLQVNPTACQPRGGGTSPPAAAFLAPDPPVSVPAGHSVHFKVRCTAGSNALAAWRLDFGDGTSADTGRLQGQASETATATHVYKKAGSTLVATLTCTDSQGVTSVPVTRAVRVRAVGLSGGGAASPWALAALGLLWPPATRRRKRTTRS